MRAEAAQSALDARCPERFGLSVFAVPAPAPSPAVLLRSATPDDRPAILVSGTGDPGLTGWSYGMLEPCAMATSLSEAEQLLAGWVDPDSGDLPPFKGGAVGWIGYDQGWRYQPCPRIPRADPLGMAGASFHLFDAVYARNEVTGEGFVLAQPSLAAHRRADRLRAGLRADWSTPAPEGRLSSPLAPLVGRTRHLERIAAVLELIRAGEAYQVNLTHPLAGRLEGAPEAAFLRLAKAAPPFATFIRATSDACVVSASPECFFDLDAATRRIAVYPIKGTRRRDPCPAQDQALARALRTDPKERAEHLMIVDLLRNDLGRIATLGSVRVDGLAYVESFPRVHHLTSRIAATLAPGISVEQAVGALFPGGSITGAPKLRAMEIIDTLEEGPRGVYTGMIGYLRPSGSIRASIAIRTAQVVRGEVRLAVGGGIVVDSLPEREWEETMLKAAALEDALRGP